MRTGRPRRQRRARGQRHVAWLLAVTAAAGACAFPEQKLGQPVDALPEAHPGGSLSIAVPGPVFLDPAAAADESSQLVVNTMCDTLVTLDPVTGEPRPGLAQSWVVTDGGRGISFRLRRGIRFQDGTAFTSKEVVESLQRLADPGTGAPTASLLADVQGFEALRQATSPDSRSLLRGARAIEPLSFEIRFESGKHADFVRALAHPATAPIRADLADQTAVGADGAPTCVGPYRLATPRQGTASDVHLVRAESGTRLEGMARGGIGFADEIHFRVFTDVGAGFAAWERGEVDVAAVPPAQARAAAARHGAAVVSGPAPRVEYIGLPAAEQSPYAVPAVRRALSAALDRTAIAESVYDGSRVAATGFLPPSLGRVARPNACQFERPVEAAQLPSVPLTLAFNDEFAHRRLAEAVARQWRERLGLEVQLMPMTWDDYLRRGTSTSGFDGAFRMSWAPRYQSSLEYLGPLFLSANVGRSNLQRWQDLEFERVYFGRAEPEQDERERELVLHELEDRLCTELPLIPVAFSRATVAMRSDRVGSARSDRRALSLTGAPLVREVFVR